MTIAVAVRTGSSVVFAADSKVTTSGLAGFGEDGEAQWTEQTYDNAVKVVHDSSKTLIAMVAGAANIGQTTAMDFIMSRNCRPIGDEPDQDAEINKLIESMVQTKRDYWQEKEVDSKNWPGPILLLAAASSAGTFPRVWRVDLTGEGSKVQEILPRPRIRLEGSYNEVFSLLYGYEPRRFSALAKGLGVESAKMDEAVQNLKVLSPIDKLSLWSMPIQDAIDLAVFLAKVQVEMDRFLPGQPACGGAIDVMVLRVVPDRAILTFPGKVLHHPGPSL